MNKVVVQKKKDHIKRAKEEEKNTENGHTSKPIFTKNQPPFLQHQEIYCKQYMPFSFSVTKPNSYSNKLNFKNDIFSRE